MSLDPSAVALMAGLVEQGVVYAVTGAAAAYLVRTMARVFRPARRRAKAASSGQAAAPSGGGCPGCDRCGR